MHISVLLTHKPRIVDRRGGEEAEGESDVGRTHSVHGTRDAESAGKHLNRGTDRRHPQSQGTCVSILTETVMSRVAVYIKLQSECCDDACDTALIETNVNK